MSPARFARTAGLLILAGTFVCLRAQEAGKQEKPEKPAAQVKPDEKPGDKPSDKPAEPPPSPADELLKQAAEKIGKLGWISTRVRQVVHVRGMKVEASGRYILAQAAPAEKVRYELQTAVAGGEGHQWVVCDGTTVWRGVHVGKQKSIQRYDQKELREQAKVSDDADEIEREVDRQIREDIVAMHGFAGVRPLLDDLRQQLHFPEMEPTALPGSDGKISVYLLKGEWRPQALERIVPKGNDAATTKTLMEQWEKGQLFVNVPRRCRLYLGKAGATDLWPYRVEWLGPNRPGGPDEVLSTVELNEPELAESPPADADKNFQIRLSPEDEKLVEKVQVSEFLKAQRKNLVDMRQQQERAKAGARTLDPTQLGPVKPGLTQPGLPKP